MVGFGRELPMILLSLVLDNQKWEQWAVDTTIEQFKAFLPIGGDVAECAPSEELHGHVDPDDYDHCVLAEITHTADCAKAVYVVDGKIFGIMREYDDHFVWAGIESA